MGVESLLFVAKPGKSSDTSTYLGFLDYLDQHTEIPEVAWTARANAPNGNYAKVLVKAASGSMWGTPYKSQVEASSTISRLIQHAMPSLDVFNDDVGRWVLVRTAAATTLSYTSTTRNGYSSSSYSGSPGVIVTSFVYYDHTVDKVMEYNPNTGNTPLPFGVSAAARWEEMASASTKNNIAYTSTIDSAVGARKTRLTALLGDMYGSTYQTTTTCRTGSALSRAIQHGLPSIDIVNDIVANNRWVIYQVVNVNSQPAFTAIDRNGYKSLASPAAAVGFTMASIIYYDVTANKIMTWTPYLAGSVPTEYTGTP